MAGLPNAIDFRDLLSLPQSGEQGSGQGLTSVICRALVLAMVGTGSSGKSILAMKRPMVRDEMTMSR